MPAATTAGRMSALDPGPPREPPSASIATSARIPERPSATPAAAGAFRRLTKNHARSPPAPSPARNTPRDAHAAKTVESRATRIRRNHIISTARNENPATKASRRQPFARARGRASRAPLPSSLNRTAAAPHANSIAAAPRSVLLRRKRTPRGPPPEPRRARSAGRATPPPDRAGRRPPKGRGASRPGKSSPAGPSQSPRLTRVLRRPPGPAPLLPGAPRTRAPREPR